MFLILIYIPYLYLYFHIYVSIWWFQLWSIRHVPKHSTNTNLTLLGICADRRGRCYVRIKITP